MDKIDRLGWTAGFSFTSFGVRVGIRVNDPQLLSRIPDYLPPEWKPARSPVVDRLYSLKAGGEGTRPGIRRYNLLYSDLIKVARSLDLEEVLDRFEADLQMHIAEFAERRVFVHAGVVGWRGRAILVPGRSFAGKTTLIAELVRAGATYYSDEYALLDSQGRSHPYARKLAIRDSEGHQQKLSAEELGGKSGSKPLPVGLVVLTSYKEDSRWRPRRLSSGKGALALLDNTVSIRRQPQRALAAVHQVAAQAAFIKGTRGDAAKAAEEILKMVESLF